MIDEKIVKEALDLCSEGMKVGLAATRLRVNRAELQTEMANYNKGFEECVLVVDKHYVEDLGKAAYKGLGDVFHKLGEQLKTGGVDTIRAGEFLYKVYKQETASTGDIDDNDPIARLFGEISEVKQLTVKNSE
jgi:hypothetical protein